MKEKDYIQIIEELRLEIIPRYYQNEKGEVVSYWQIKNADVIWEGISLKEGIEIVAEETRKEKE
jgi:hypothetical protein